MPQSLVLALMGFFEHAPNIVADVEAAVAVIAKGEGGLGKVAAGFNAVGKVLSDAGAAVSAPPAADAPLAKIG